MLIQAKSLKRKGTRILKDVIQWRWMTWANRKEGKKTSQELRSLELGRPIDNHAGSARCWHHGDCQVFTISRDHAPCPAFRPVMNRPWNAGQLHLAQLQLASPPLLHMCPKAPQGHHNEDDQDEPTHIGHGGHVDVQERGWVVLVHLHVGLGCLDRDLRRLTHPVQKHLDQ